MHAGWAVFVQQTPDWQGPPEQLAQASPFTPQADWAVPAWQLSLPSQQPLQLPVAQIPPQPSEAPLHLPPQFGVQLGLHVPLAQTSFDGQAVHVAPLVPQASFAEPASQIPLALQQPLQLVAGQKPPQPFGAPVHFPAQLAVQLPPVELPPVELPVLPFEPVEPPVDPDVDVDVVAVPLPQASASAARTDASTERTLGMGPS